MEGIVYLAEDYDYEGWQLTPFNSMDELLDEIAWRKDRKVMRKGWKIFKEVYIGEE